MICSGMDIKAYRRGVYLDVEPGVGVGL